MADVNAPHTDSATLIQPLEEFHRFPKLPIEIRLHVFSFLLSAHELPIPILISQHATPQSEDDQAKNVDRFGPRVPGLLKFNIHLTSPQAEHPLLFVNHESRAEFIKNNPHKLQLYKDGPMVFFDGEKDTLSFDEVSLVVLYK
jgi:hypothetical protein